MSSSLLVLGGARSGKSRYAELRAETAGGKLIYIATAEAGDEEMAARISDHRARRDECWLTVEAPIALPQAVTQHCGDGCTLLIDCLTLWLSNLILAEHDLDAETASLLDAVGGASGALILVSNEVGLGVVPDNPLGRRFRDAAGRLNSQVAAAVDEVIFVAAGLPLTLKGERG